MYQKKTNMEPTLTIKKPKTFVCMDCGVQYKIAVSNAVTKPKYCSYCNSSKIKK